MQIQADLILLAAGGGSYMNSLPPESPKEEMVLLKLESWVKNAAAAGCEQNFLP